MRTNICNIYIYSFNSRITNTKAGSHGLQRLVMAPELSDGRPKMMKKSSIKRLFLAIRLKCSPNPPKFDVGLAEKLVTEI